MRKLTGSLIYLILKRGATLADFRVSFAPSLDIAITEWDWTTRSSPIFPFEGTGTSDLNNSNNLYMYFVGPLDPGLLDIDVDAFATLGTYNLILTTPPSEEKAFAVERFLQDHPNTHWERWRVTNGAVQEVSFSNALTKGLVSAPHPTRAIVPQSLNSAEEENCTLLAASMAKSALYFPEIAVELERFATAFKEKLENSDKSDDNTKLSWLVNVNAHLSRYTSQTFSGVTPIMATECHFWSHSLLGVGTACQALVNIRRFVQVAVGHSDWIDCLDRLGKLPLSKNWIPLIQRETYRAQEWFDLEKQVTTAIELEQEEAPTRPKENNERMPLIVCYSGRDGFRSTPFSMTAPLEVISGANTFGWTPMTLSHEICHVWMSGILGTIFPDLKRPPAVDDIGQLLNNERTAATPLDDLRQAFYFCYNLLYREELDIPDTQDEIPSDNQLPWPEVVERFALQVNEMLTHILDYQFFYQQDEERYIRSIWSSWDVIPNIKERLGSYLIRSACALLSERINHDDALNATLDRLRNVLSELYREMNTANYLAEALAILERDREVLRIRLERRALLVRLAKTVFANRAIAARLEKEHQEPGGPYSSLTPLTLDYRQIWNPLRFVSHFSKDREVSRPKAMWILTKIAFMQDPNATFA